jgi:hypothetical protein
VSKSEEYDRDHEKGYGWQRVVMIRFVPISPISTSNPIVFLLLVDLPESPVTSLIVAQSSIVELACVDSSTFIVQRNWFIQPRRANGHVHTVHGCCVAGRCNCSKLCVS